MEFIIGVCVMAFIMLIRPSRHHHFDYGYRPLFRARRPRPPMGMMHHRPMGPRGSMGFGPQRGHGPHHF